MDYTLKSVGFCTGALCSFGLAAYIYTQSPLIAAVSMASGIVFSSQIFKNCMNQQLSVNDLDRYTKTFNQDNENTAVFLPPNFSMLEENGTDWNEPYRAGTDSFFSRLISNFKMYNKNISKNFSIENMGELRKALENAGKNILALPINLKSGLLGRHWTVIHFNFKDRNISYIDSIKPNKQAEKVKERLEQALTWIRTTDNDKTWKINQPENDDTQPSILTKCKQYDFWNCGIFAIHFTALAGKGKTYAEMDDTPICQMYHEIADRRLEVMGSYK